MSILVIEDDRLTAANIRQMLTDAGHHVIGVAFDGVTALRLADESPPDIALCDVHLQGLLSGVTVGRELAAQGVGVIYVTGDMTGAVMEGRDHAADFINKPFDEATLLATIARTAGAAGRQ